MSRLALYAEHPRARTGVPVGEVPRAAWIAEDLGLVDGPGWAGRVVLLVGCSPFGPGPEAARAAHHMGADVYIAVRDPAKGQAFARELRADGRPGAVDVVRMDLAALESVRAGVDDFLDRSDGRLHVLINSAGHSYLFHLLKDTLVASTSSSFNSRVISLTPAAHRRGEAGLGGPNFDSAEHDASAANGQARLANVYFVSKLDRTYQSQNLRALGFIRPS
ncbi:hypothetical protein GGR56DRAFT_685474 [Xylariaceae sp. FL0804]|nr:hypothetical protein GGR56DRAFT_685474 [Xylariaceae sp. FL0804]